MLAVTVDGPAPALGEWSFPSPECEEMDLNIIGHYKVEVTEDTIQFPVSLGRLFVVDRLCTKTSRYTYIGLRQRRQTGGREIGASGAGIWLKDTMLDGKQALGIAANLFSEIWNIYDQRFYIAKIEIAKIKTSEFPVLADLFGNPNSPERPLILKGGLGSEGLHSDCIVDASGMSGSDGLEKALTIVQTTELLSSFRRVFISDDPEILQAIKHSKRYLTLYELETEDRQSASVGAFDGQGSASGVVAAPAATNSDPHLRAQIAEIVHEEMREHRRSPNGSSKPARSPKTFDLLRPLGLVQQVVVPGLVGGLVGGLAALAVLRFASTPVSTHSHPIARSQTEQSSDPTYTQSTGAAVAPQTEISSGGHENSVNQCDVAMVRQEIDDLVANMGTLKLQQKQVVDAIRTNLDRLKRAAAVPPDGGCRSIQPPAP